MPSLLDSWNEAERGDLESFQSALALREAIVAIWQAPDRDQEDDEVWSIETEEGLSFDPPPPAAPSVPAYRHAPASLPSPSPVYVPSRSVAIPEVAAWSIAFTPTFRKSVASVDKKLQGRVLVAIAELSESPVKAQGDTIKPLVGNLKGTWRYRMGAYRLFYRPLVEGHMVVLLEFSARGGAYD